MEAGAGRDPLRGEGAAGAGGAGAGPGAGVGGAGGLAPGGVGRDPTRGETAAARTGAPMLTRAITADPGPLGLGAFAMTTFVLSMYNAHLVTQKGVSVVLGLALFYGGVAQLLAGMWEFRTGNTFGATAFTSFGAFWLSFWALNQFYAKTIAAGGAGAVNSAVGLYLIAWAIFTGYMLIASLRTTGAIALVFLLLTATFILLGIGNANGSVNTVKIGGYVGLATAAAAWYASFAGVVNSTFARIILPVVDFRAAGAGVE